MTPILGGPAARVSLISINPGLQSSGDLEAATKTISAVAEPAVADYTSSLTLAAPTDTRLVVNNIGVYLTLTIDSWGGGGAVLNYRLKRAGVSIGTGTVATASATGQKIIGLNVVNPAGLGSANAYTLFLWVDVDTCVISEVTIQVAWGCTQSTGNPVLVATLTNTGTTTFMGRAIRVGTGNFRLYVSPTLDSVVGFSPLAYQGITNTIIDGINWAMYPIHSPGALYLYVWLGSVATDLCYISYANIMLSDFR